MKIVGSAARPILDLPQQSRLRGMQAVDLGGEPYLVAAIQRGGDPGIDIIAAASGSIVYRIDLRDPSTTNKDLLTAVAHRGSQAVVIGAPAFQPIRQWSLPDGEPIAEWKPPDLPKALGVADRAGTTTVLLAVGDTVHQLDAATGRPVGPRLPARERKRLFGSGTPLQSVAAAGDRVLAGDNEGAVWCWDAESGALAGRWRSAHTGSVVRISAYPTVNGWMAATVGADFRVRLWDVASGQRYGDQVGAAQDVPRLAALTEGGQAHQIVASTDLVVHRLDAATGARLATLVTFEADDPDENPFEDAAIDEICTIDGRTDVFVAAPYGIWRVTADPRR